MRHNISVPDVSCCGVGDLLEVAKVPKEATLPTTNNTLHWFAHLWATPRGRKKWEGKNVRQFARG